jgi:hypothetical protein
MTPNRKDGMGKPALDREFRTEMIAANFGHYRTLA